MASTRNYIEFIICVSGEEHRIKTYRGEYRDLRALINDRFFLDDFGQCGGMGRCATCIVEVQGNNKDVHVMKRNEETTLSKIKMLGRDIRLACQIPLDDEIANTRIQLADYY